MPMISDVTTNLIGRMLDLESLRASAAGRNIANANVSGYQPVQVDFQSQLAAVREELGQPDGLAAAVDNLGQGGFKVEHESTSSLLGAGVNLDNEVASMAIANTQYESLVESLNRHFSLMRLAITGQE